MTKTEIINDLAIIACLNNEQIEKAQKRKGNYNKEYYERCLSETKAHENPKNMAIFCLALLCGGIKFNNENYSVHPKNFTKEYCPTICKTLESAKIQKIDLQKKTGFEWEIEKLN